MASWTWTAASRRGTAHAEAGERRQDAFRIAVPGSDDGFLVAVACDGAGSASHGGQGASIAAWTLAEAARSWLTAEGRLPEAAAVEMWVALARFRIAAAAARRELRPGDFATTLVMAVSNGASTLTAHIGDGAIVGREAASGCWSPLSWPEHGEYAATTFFVTDEPGVRLRVLHHDTPLDRLAVMTDGLERLALDFTSGTPHAPFFDALFRPVAVASTTGANRPLSARLAAYLDAEQVTSRTDDDKTVILAARV